MKVATTHGQDNSMLAFGFTCRERVNEREWVRIDRLGVGGGGVDCFPPVFPLSLCFSAVCVQVCFRLQSLAAHIWIRPVAVHPDVLRF